jgi:hypothetical protein
VDAPREPGWYPDPEAPATLQRYHDGAGWTDDSRPAGYVTQPAGPAPVAQPPDTSPVFGAAPPPSPEPGEARRRLTAGVAVAVAIAVGTLVLLVLLLLGVL